MWSPICGIARPPQPLSGAKARHKILAPNVGPFGTQQGTLGG